MKSNCRSCGAEIYWLKQQKANGTISPKPSPIDAERNEKGNIIVSPDGRRYRIATEEEIATAKDKGVKLFISHFASCKHAAAHRAEAQEKAAMLSKRAKRDKAMAALHGPIKEK